MTGDGRQTSREYRILNPHKYVRGRQGISKSEVEIAAPSTSLRAKGFFGSAPLAMMRESKRFRIEKAG